MEPDREAPGRLGEAMDKRRLELRPPLKWNQVADRAGLSIGHLSRIRKGESPPSKMAASQIESALEWPPGTVARLVGDETLSTASPDARSQADPSTPRPVLPPHLAHIEDPTPKEAAMLQYLASMQEELRALHARVEEQESKIEALAAEREHDSATNGAPHQKGA